MCYWAACCIGFFTFLQLGEFTCSSWSSYDSSTLSLGNVSIDCHSQPTMVHLTLRRSKTDVFGAGVTIHLGKTGSILCPVSSLLAHLAICPATPGPLFLFRSGAPLSREILVRAVRSALSSTGIDASLFHSHSFRIGAATTASFAGLPDSTIKMLGRWKSSAFVCYPCPPVQSIAGCSRRLLNMMIYNSLTLYSSIVCQCFSILISVICLVLSLYVNALFIYLLHRSVI